MILLGLGSSLPFCGASPQEVLRLAIRAIGVFAPVERASRLYESPAWPDHSDPTFVNAVIAVSFNRGPGELLAAAHAVEAALGRIRNRRNAPRTLDIDVLAFGRLVSSQEQSGDPDLPHPGLQTRDFVLAPLCDIAPRWICPRSGRTAAELLANLKTVTARPLAA